MEDIAKLVVAWLQHSSGSEGDVCVPIEFPIKFDTVKSGWSIVYIEGSQVISSQKNIFHSLKIDFVLANSTDPDKMLHLIRFFTVCQSTHFGVSGLQKVKIRG